MTIIVNSELHANIANLLAVDIYVGMIDISTTVTIFPPDPTLPPQEGTMLGEPMVGVPTNDDAMDGNGGDDTIMAMDGADAVMGGVGSDSIQGGAGDDAIRGDDGDDTMEGGDGDDLIIHRIGQGIASIDGGFGQDILMLSAAGVSAANTFIVGATGGLSDGSTIANIETVAYFSSDHGDTAVGGSNADTLNGGAGADDLDGGAGDDVVVALAGNDEVEGGAGADSLNGGAGIDTVVYASSDAAVTVNLGTGATSGGHAAGDWVLEFENVTGSDHDDLLTGDGLANQLNGGDGYDRLEGGSGDDTLHGNNFGDTLVGGDGNDLMIGGMGNDSYFVKQLGDAVYETAAEGYDVVRVYFDDYSLTANVEELRLMGSARVGTGNSLDNLLVGSGARDTLNGALGDDQINGGAGGDSMIGGTGQDVLFGQAGFDTLNGGTGDDRLDGGDDIDSLLGGSGADTVDGGAGRDTVSGGSGADRFKFDDGDHAGADFTQADRILDFSQTEGDRIDLRGTDAVEGGEIDAFAFVGTAAFSGTAGELRYEQSGGRTYVSGDTDGDTVADFMIRFEAIIDFVEADFVT